MAQDTKIEWADHTFNPWVGCTKVSPACDHCYAEAWAKRGGKAAGVVWGGERRRTSKSTWAAPLKWNAQAQAEGRRYRVFCASLADVFDNQVPEWWRWDLFRLIAVTPHLDWLLLTKRIGNARGMLNNAAAAVAGEFVGAAEWDGNPWSNVWIGATICNQAEADRDIPKLLEVPASVRFLSVEPLLGPVDLRFHFFSVPTGETRTRGGLRQMKLRKPDDGGVHWVIVGGESGPGARPMHPDWVRGLRDQCRRADVPFLFKQWGEWWHGARIGKAAAGRMLDGVDHTEFPAVARIACKESTD
ncbi:phage Gp37/Gp68 family protein [Ideonella paludis]|uniref:Phage Gp37/Gp68 family protein n=1 Tax=Ideonella paludis TaxID=1233411 RepID=A0ABS5E007_9BURK|nr:phage Gp37/Gp68 family protein [Ideonella paludis]MBQ0936736.1 phage Gp37/Gp68 family protein [Ideonella paludis]